MKMRVKLAFIAVFVLMIASVAQAEIEITPTVGFSVDYNGKYVWRGQNVTDDPVLQPSTSIGLGNLTLGVWGNMETTSVNGEKNALTEVDYTIDYSASVPGTEELGYSVGLINYDFPTGTAQTYELYLGLSLDTLLSPSFTYYYDYDDVKSSYVSVGIGHSMADILGEGSGVSADLSASLGWGAKKYNNAYWGVNESAVNDIAFAAAFPFPAGPVTVTPSLNYIILSDSSIKGSTNFGGPTSDLFFAGIGASIEF